MISPVLTADLSEFRATVQAAKPLSALTPLQLSVLVQQGQALVARVDAALAATGAVLDGPEPSGHPLEMIKAVRERREAGRDIKHLADIRGLLGRAVLNLAQGYA